jgi:serine/threonine protein kinase
MNDERVIGDRYKIENLINRGGMGDVYRALDTQSGQRVAIKTLSRQVLQEDMSLVERFRREADVLKRLEHPNIVKILATLDSDGDQHIIMEYVTGGSLAQLLAREGKLPLARALQISLDLSDALTRAHRLRILHRDIKPANILLAEDGTPRLTDFGVAQMGDQQTRLTRQGALVGTVAYLAPELCEGKDYSEQTDIWSFGLVLYEMLAGRNPFQSERLGEVVGAILNEPVPDMARFRDDVPSGVRDLLGQMLQKSPTERIQSIRAVGTALEQLVRFPEKESLPEPPTSSAPVPLVSPAPVVAAPPLPAASSADTDGVRVFISYRREQSAKLVERVVEKLAASFGRERVLRDIDRLSLRTVSRLVLASEILGNCTHMLVIIGRDWLHANQDALQNPKDVVRVEIETALKGQTIKIVPVLVDNAVMPRAEDLPSALQPLAALTPIQLSSGMGFELGMQRIVAWASGRSEQVLPWRWIGIALLVLLSIVVLFLLLRPA